MVDRLAASGRFVATAASPVDGPGRRGDARPGAWTSILVVPPDFERDLSRDRTASVQLILNAEDGAAAGVIQSYAGRILASYARELGAEVAPTLASVSARAERPPSAASR